MTSMYEARLKLMENAPFDTGPVPEHGIVNPISELLAEYYRRVARFDGTLLVRIPPAPDRMRAWFARHLENSEVARVEHDASELREHLEERQTYASFITMSPLFRLILMWSHLVDRNELSLDDDPSVPLLAIFAAGYSLKWVSHGLEIWGEVPWAVDPTQVLRRAGLGE